MEKIATSVEPIAGELWEKLKNKNIYPFPYIEVHIPMDEEIYKYLNSSKKACEKVIFRTNTINGIQRKYPFFIVDIRKLVEFAEELETK